MLEDSVFEKIIDSTLISFSISEKVQPDCVECDFYDESIFDFTTTPELTRIIEFLNDKHKKEFENPNVTHRLVEDEQLIYELTNVEIAKISELVVEFKKKYNVEKMQEMLITRFLDRCEKEHNIVCFPFIWKQKDELDLTNNSDNNVGNGYYSLINLNYTDSIENMMPSDEWITIDADVMSNLSKKNKIVLGRAFDVFRNEQQTNKNQILTVPSIFFETNYVKQQNIVTSNIGKMNGNLSFEYRDNLFYICTKKTFGDIEKTNRNILNFLCRQGFIDQRHLEQKKLEELNQFTFTIDEKHYHKYLELKESVKHEYNGEFEKFVSFITTAVDEKWTKENALLFSFKSNLASLRFPVDNFDLLNIICANNVSFINIRLLLANECEHTILFQTFQKSKLFYFIDCCRAKRNDKCKQECKFQENNNCVKKSKNSFDNSSIKKTMTSDEKISEILKERQNLFCKDFENISQRKEPIILVVYRFTTMKFEEQTELLDMISKLKPNSIVRISFIDNFSSTQNDSFYNCQQSFILNYFSRIRYELEKKFSTFCENKQKTNNDESLCHLKDLFHQFHNYESRDIYLHIKPLFEPKIFDLIMHSSLFNDLKIVLQTLYSISYEYEQERLQIVRKIISKITKESKLADDEFATFFPNCRIQTVSEKRVNSEYNLSTLCCKIDNFSNPDKNEKDSIIHHKPSIFVRNIRKKNFSDYKKYLDKNYHQFISSNNNYIEENERKSDELLLKRCNSYIVAFDYSKSFQKRITSPNATRMNPNTESKLKQGTKIYFPDDNQIGKQHCATAPHFFFSLLTFLSLCIFILCDETK